MIIGVPKEIKNHEYRVGLTPGSVRELIEHGHSVLVETGAAVGIGMMDADYTRVGATISPTAQEVFANSELIVKVKEPQPAECRMLGAGQVLFTYLHLAPDPNQAQLLLESGVTAIAYETVTGPGNTLPLLAPMSEVAGRLSIQAGAHCLERAQGGQGVLLSGVPGVAPARLLVIGGGTVGDNAAHMARGVGADVTILDRSIPRLRQLDQHYEGSIKCVHSTSEAVEHYALQADLVIGAVLVPGATTPKVLTADVVRRMKTGSVVVDVSIDQGGCFETARPTTHEAPTYVVDGVVHYCVANMPSVVPRTSTLALNNATLPFVLTLADRGFPDALRFDPDLAQGLNIHEGKVTHEAVARDLGYEHHSVDSVLGLTRGFSATA
jgi:alanine dehydrogenase